MSQDPIKMPIGPITRSRAKRYQNNLNLYCQDWFNDFDICDELLDLGRKDVCLLFWLGLDGDRECIEGIVEVGKEEDRKEAEKDESTQAEKKWKPPRPGGLIGGPQTTPTTAQKRQKLRAVC